jgi:alpha-ketoglutarate-dependent taurine dioxygenase
MTSPLKSPLRIPAAWTRASWAHDQSWICELSAAERAELVAAVEGIRRQGLGVGGFGAAEFPLPVLAARIRALQTELEDGRGFVLLRGFPLDQISDADAEILFWGFGQNFGALISQNGSGERLGHVRDEGYQHAVGDKRGYQTAARLNYHTDNCDVVGLLCLRTAKEGGLSSFTSAIAMYNEILREHPEYLPTLHRGFIYDLRGEQLPGKPPLSRHPIPVYSNYAGRLSVRYVRTHIDLAWKKGAPRLTDDETRILDYFGRLADRDDLRHDMAFQRGDVQLLNNHVIVHSRTDFIDHDDPKLKRHLLRLWINLPNGRPLAADFADRYNAGDRQRLGVPVLDCV